MTDDQAANETPQRLTYTVDEASKILGISRGGAYELARRGELPGAIRLGPGRVVVSKAKLEAFINGVPSDASV